MLDKKKIIENLLFERNAEEIKYTTNEAIAEHRQQCDYLIKMLAGQPKIGEWIPCSERLPEKHIDVLVSFGDNVPVIAWYSEINRQWKNSSTANAIKAKVIAWMPLPEPYRGGDEE